MSTEQGPAAADRGANLTRAGGVVAGMTGLSRLSGFLRDVVISHAFGAGAAADAFFVAFRIPNFFRRLFAEGAFAQAFVPVLADFRRGPRAAYAEFVRVMAGNLGSVVVLVSLLGILIAPALVTAFAPGFAGDANPARFDLTVALLRVTFPYLAFISLVAFAGSILNSHGRFAVPAFTPVLLNLSLITAALLVVPRLEVPALGLAWGVFVAGAVQLLFQAPSLRRLELLAWPRLDLRHQGARRVGVLLVPALLASSASQINTLIDTMIASTLATGSISWLYYADRLLELPVGLVAVALGTVLLPNLSRLHAAGARQEFQATLAWGMTLALLLGLPAAMALYLLALPLVSAIFLHGEMTPADARMAALALQAFAPGLVGILLVKVLAPGFFARKDTRTPLNYAFAAVLINVVLNLALFRIMGHVGLALATSAATLTNGFLLLRGLQRGGHLRLTGELAWHASRTLLAVLAMAVALVAAAPADPWWLANGSGARWVAIGALILLGGAVYGLAQWLLGLRPGALRHRV
ncbi:MAG: murein biosynthesis integral membrane protein MurJ [Pseudomonadota bacterium]